MQAAWCENEGIELFAEGDVYPRPRYAVPARQLEIFDFAIIASGEMDGILKYMLDYNRPYNYENGYVRRHLGNAELRTALASIFEGKRHVGLRIFENMRKIRKYEFPLEYEQGISGKAWNAYFSIAQKIASEQAIPTVYKAGGKYPSVVFGENARYLEESDLKNGLILDAVAARILKSRGIDTGLIESENHAAYGEEFISFSDEIRGIDDISAKRCAISEKATVETVFHPSGTPASYFYENQSGYRFFVLCIDAYSSNKNSVNYFNNYYRQQQMLSAVEWLCGRSLPAVITKQPYLYMQAAENKDGTALSVALFNMNIDEVITPEIRLGREYRQVKLVGCEGGAFWQYTSSEKRYRAIWHGGL